MAKRLPVTHREWFKDNTTAFDKLKHLHRENQFGRDIPCPTGDSDTCPQCMTLDALIAEREQAKRYLEQEGYDTTEVEILTPPVNIFASPLPV